MEQSKRKEFTDYLIQSVKQERSGDSCIWMDFKVADCTYEFEIEFSSGEYELKNIYHHGAKDRNRCPFCSNDLYICETLTKKKEEVFKQLIRHPAIRLYWITRKPSIE